MIPFNKPFIAGKELYYIAQTVMVDLHLSGNGNFTKRCQSWIEEILGTPKTLITHSCTAALEMAAILCDTKAGDEIIMPSYTFVSTANAFVLRGGRPVFVDIRRDTLNINEKLIANAITENTKAIVCVHYAGISCAMDQIMEIADNYNLLVVEDAAQGFYSDYKGKMLGTIGDLGCLSFHETKNIICGEGGALLINNEKFRDRAEIIWEKGTNRKRFLSGEVDKYTWVDIGSSFLPSEQVAAFLYAQLEQSESIIENRRNTFKTYYDSLLPLESQGFFRLPGIKDKNLSNGHLFFIITRSLDERNRLIQHLTENEIYAVFHYIPLHSSPAGRKYCRVHGTMDVTNEISDRILRLPLYYGMNESDVHKVVDCIRHFYLP